MTTSSNAAARINQPSSPTAISAQPLSLEVFKQISPGVSLYRLKQVLTRIPVSRSAWFAGIITGRFPRGYSLGPRTTVWKSDDIDQLVAGLPHVGAQALR